MKWKNTEGLHTPLSVTKSRQHFKFQEEEAEESLQQLLLLSIHGKTTALHCKGPEGIPKGAEEVQGTLHQ